MKRRRRSAKRRRSRARTPRPTAVDRLRAICLALPDTTEKLAWSEPTWRVRGKLFAQLDNHHHGADHLAVWLPAPLGEQEAMIFTDPARFFRPRMLSDHRDATAGVNRYRERLRFAPSRRKAIACECDALCLAPLPGLGRGQRAHSYGRPTLRIEESRAGRNRVQLSRILAGENVLSR
jgi:hypothetical protein